MAITTQTQEIGFFEVLLLSLLSKEGHMTCDIQQWKNELIELMQILSEKFNIVELKSYELVDAIELAVYLKLVEKEGREVYLTEYGKSWMQVQLRKFPILQEILQKIKDKK